MIKKSDWLIDPRPCRSGLYGREGEIAWEEWINRHRRDREQWLMSIIDTLLRNGDWAGGYLLIKTYIVSLKVGEHERLYNKTPFDESVHVRAVRRWFWYLCEIYGFAMPEDEIPYDVRDLENRRFVSREAEGQFPFVGGKPKRRYSETVKFFESVTHDRRLLGGARCPDDVIRPRREGYLAPPSASKGPKIPGRPRGRPRKNA